MHFKTIWRTFEVYSDLNSLWALFSECEAIIKQEIRFAVPYVQNAFNFPRNDFKQI